VPVHESASATGRECWRHLAIELQLWRGQRPCQSVCPASAACLEGAGRPTLSGSGHRTARGRVADQVINGKRHGHSCGNHASTPRNVLGGQRTLS